MHLFIRRWAGPKVSKLGQKFEFQLVSGERMVRFLAYLAEGQLSYCRGVASGVRRRRCCRRCRRCRCRQLGASVLKNCVIKFL